MNHLDVYRLLHSQVPLITGLDARPTQRNTGLASTTMFQDDRSRPGSKTLVIPVANQSEAVLKLTNADLRHLPFIRHRLETPSGTGSSPDRFRAALSLIWRHHGGLRTEALAAKLGVSGTTLDAAFHRHFNLTTAHYRRRYQAELTIAMLHTTGLSKQLVCQHMGYKSLTAMFNNVAKWLPDCEPRWLNSRASPTFFLARKIEEPAEDDQPLQGTPEQAKVAMLGLGAKASDDSDDFLDTLVRQLTPARASELSLANAVGQANTEAQCTSLDQGSTGVKSVTEAQPIGAGIPSLRSHEPSGGDNVTGSVSTNRSIAAAELLAVYLQMVRYVESTVEQTLSDGGLTKLQWQVLVEMSARRAGKFSACDAAGVIGRSPTQVRKLLQSLVAKGWIQCDASAGAMQFQVPEAVGKTFSLGPAVFERLTRGFELAIPDAQSRFTFFAQMSSILAIWKHG
jgi:AraC-like DNA-binding protein